MSSNLTGRKALVTGGGSGAGKVIALALADAGADVRISGRSENTLAALSSSHSNIRHAVADTSVEAEVSALFDQIGSCDIVVANAGISVSAPLARTELEGWETMIATNLTGVFLTFREALRRMPSEADYGRLIAVASTAGLKGYAYAAPYAASKHGVVGLVRSLALEMAKTAVTVNAVCPGFLDTEMTDRSVAAITDKTGLSAEEARAKLARMNPQGRLISPQEVASSILWLCGAESGSVNGQAITLSGGEI